MFQFSDYGLSVDVVLLGAIAAIKTTSTLNP